MRARMVAGILVGFLLFGVGIPPSVTADSRSPQELRRQYDQHAYRLSPRGMFRVLQRPPMAPAKEADRTLRDRQWVIGVAHRSEAKAYPVSVIGRHELVNDVIGGHPIAVCW